MKEKSYLSHQFADNMRLKILIKNNNIANTLIYMNP